MRFSGGGSLGEQENNTTIQTPWIALPHFGGCPNGGSQIRTEKIVPVPRVSFWRGVLRDYLLRRRWVLKFLGKRRKRQLLRSLFSDPLPEGHPVDRDHFLRLTNGGLGPLSAVGAQSSAKEHRCGLLGPS